MSKHIKETVIEVLEEGESTIFGKPSGKYWLRCYEDDLDMSGSFYKTLEEAEKEAGEWKKS